MTWRTAVRLATGAGSLIIKAAATMSSVKSAIAANEPALQILELWIQAIFYVMVFTGPCVGAYVVSRAGA